MTKVHVKFFILAGIIGSFLVFPQQFIIEFVFNFYLFLFLHPFVLFNPITWITVLINTILIVFIIRVKKIDKLIIIISFMICLLLFIIVSPALRSVDLDGVAYVAALNIINTVLFIIFFAGYYYLNKNTKIAKYLTLCSLVISCLSLIIFMLFFINNDWFLSFRRTFFKLSSSWTWAVFFLGLASHKTNDTHDNKYFEIPLLLATLFLFHGFLSLTSYTFFYKILLIDGISLFGILSLTVGVLRLYLLINMYIARTT